MSRDQEAAHIFRLFLGRNPDDKERNDLTTLGLGHDGYLWHDVGAGINRPIMLMYTSCHAEQFLAYLRQYRPEILTAHHVIVLFTHRLLLHRGFFNLDLVHAIFGSADLLITNPMNPKFEELSTVPLLPKCKSTCKIATFVPPSVAAFWPVVEVFGEEPIAKAMLDGLTVDQAVDSFMQSKMDFLFAYRYQSQMERLKRREQDCDVGISGFIDKHLKTHKMFFTANHPTFNLVGYMVEQLLVKLGFESKGSDDWVLQLPINGAGFSNHYPETAYEWGHYGFQYPIRWEREWGGPHKFYPEIIRKAYGTIKDPKHTFSNPIVPVELEP